MPFLALLDACYARLGTDALYTPQGGVPGPVRVIARRPDRTLEFGAPRVWSETAVFEVRASEVAAPRPGDRLEVGASVYLVQGEPERRDPDRLVWTLEGRPQ